MVACIISHERSSRTVIELLHKQNCRFSLGSKKLSSITEQSSTAFTAFYVDVPWKANQLQHVTIGHNSTIPSMVAPVTQPASALGLKLL